MGAVDRCVLHYIEMRVDDGVQLVENFVTKYGFKIVGERQDDLFAQWLLESGTCRFMITEVKCNIPANTRLAGDPFITNIDGLEKEYETCNYKPSLDMVYNVAIEVRDLAAYIQKLSKCNVVILKPLTKVSDKNGEILIATVKSCLENISHTLVQVINLNGNLMPGFQPPSNWSISLNAKRAIGVQISYVDHVTFVCETGRASSTVAWYEKCFGMKNFILNRESEDGSLVVSGKNVGLKLSAFDYWKCAETGLCYPGTGDNKLIFVIGEPYGNVGHCHLKKFLSLHNGPGIQHVGLHTTNIIQTLQILTQNGVDFVQTPDTFYKDEYFLQKVEELGELVKDDLNEIIKLGVLIDSEESPENDKSKERYLMQKFTKPIFNKETFFLEIIQRHGARGFGSGNIMALCRAIEQLQCTQVSQ